VQQIAVQVIGAELPERLLAGFDRALPGSVFRKDLGDQKNTIAHAVDRLADVVFSPAVELAVSMCVMPSSTPARSAATADARESRCIFQVP
jgi:hypothetical protein